MGFAEFGAAGGRPLVFCHGFPSSRLGAALLDAPATALGVRVIAPDRPGHGLSDFQRRRRVAHWPADVASLADALGLDRFVVLGVSAGGPYAIACAALLRGRVTSAGVASGWAPRSAPRTNPRGRLPFVPGLGRNVRLLRRFALSRAAKRLGRNGLRFLDRATRDAPAADRAVIADPEHARLIVDDMREAFRQGARGPARDATVIGARWGFRVEEVGAPVWLWHGQEDQQVPVAKARHVAERIPGSRTLFYAQEGHLSTVVNHAREILQALASV